MAAMSNVMFRLWFHESQNQVSCFVAGLLTHSPTLGAAAFPSLVLDCDSGLCGGQGVPVRAGTESSQQRVLFRIFT